MSVEIFRPSGLSVRDELLYIAARIARDEPGFIDKTTDYKPSTWKSDRRIYGGGLAMAMTWNGWKQNNGIVVDRVTLGNDDYEITVDRATSDAIYKDEIGLSVYDSFQEYYSHPHYLCFEIAAELALAATAAAEGSAEAYLPSYFSS